MRKSSKIINLPQTPYLGKFLTPGGVVDQIRQPGNARRHPLDHHLELDVTPLGITAAPVSGRHRSQVDIDRPLLGDLGDLKVSKRHGL